MCFGHRTLGAALLVPSARDAVLTRVVCGQVHFGPDGVAAQSVGPEGVEAAARGLVAALDALAQQTGAQATQLARALAQVDAYCADVARLRAQLLTAEQALRQAAQPNYSPREPERAHRTQQVSSASRTHPARRWLASILVLFIRPGGSQGDRQVAGTLHLTCEPRSSIIFYLSFVFFLSPSSSPSPLLTRRTDILR